VIGLREFDLNLVDESSCFIAPSLSGTSDAYRVSGVLLSRIPFVDWHLLEKSKFTDDLVDVYAMRRPPYFFIFADPGAPESDEASNLLMWQRRQVVARLTLALRMATDQAVPDPLDFTSYNRRGPTNTRYNSRMGRSGYSYRPEISIDDALDDWETVVEALEFVQCFRRVVPLSRSLALYHQSFDALLPDEATRRLLLHSAIEVLCGSQIGRLAEISWDDGDLAETVRLRKSNRNSLAHGAGGQGVSLQNLRRLSRLLLVEAIRLAVLAPNVGAEWSHVLIESAAVPDRGTFDRLRDLPVDSESLLYPFLRRRDQPNVERAKKRWRILPPQPR
jgi:hypothetical protein